MTVFNKKSKKKISIMEIISWDVLMFCQILLLPQVKRSEIIGVYEMPDELPNDLRIKGKKKNQENIKIC